MYFHLLMLSCYYICTTVIISRDNSVNSAEREERILLFCRDNSVIQQIYFFFIVLLIFTEKLRKHNCKCSTLFFNKWHFCNLIVQTVTIFYYSYFCKKYFKCLRKSSSLVSSPQVQHTLKKARLVYKPTKCNEVLKR